MIANTNTYRPGEALARNTFLALLNSALTTNEIRFARQSTLQWLSVFPGDLEVRKIHAETIAKVRGPDEALPLLENLSEIDPHWVELQQLIFEYRQILGIPTAGESAAAVLALGGKLKYEVILPDWGVHLAKASKSWRASKIDEAEILIQRALMNDPPTPLIASMHLEVLRSSGQTSPRAVRSLAEHYRNRWPECAPINLYLANALMDGGKSEQAVNLIHKVVAIDVAGQVPVRMWGPRHPYRALWPDSIETKIDESIPAAVSAVMGWNQLTAGTISKELEVSVADTVPAATDELVEIPDPVQGLEISEKPQSRWARWFTPRKGTELAEISDPALENDNAESQEDPPTISIESDPLVTPAQVHTDENLPESDAEETELLRSVQAELERVAHRLKKPYLAKTDGRFPVYVLFSTRQGLEQKYGPTNAEAITFEMGRLEQTIKEDSTWDSLIIFGDDPKSTTPLGIKPGKPRDAGALKLVLKDLDEALRKRGEMIGRH